LKILSKLYIIFFFFIYSVCNKKSAFFLFDININDCINWLLYVFLFWSFFILYRKKGILNQLLSNRYLIYMINILFVVLFILFIFCFFIDLSLHFNILNDYFNCLFKDLFLFKCVKLFVSLSIICVNLCITFINRGYFNFSFLLSFISLCLIVINIFYYIFSISLFNLFCNNVFIYSIFNVFIEVFLYLNCFILLIEMFFIFRDLTGLNFYYKLFIR